MPSPKTLITSSTLAAALCVSMGAHAQHVEGDVTDPIMRQARMNAEPGTFWLDSMDDREVVRYTTPRDVSLCLPRPTGVSAADKGYPLTLTWDQVNTAILYPGNCFYFDAKRVSIKPAETLPSGVTLTGKVETASALQK